jgi:plastocyanin
MGNDEGGIPMMLRPAAVLGAVIMALTGVAPGVAGAGEERKGIEVSMVGTQYVPAVVQVPAGSDVTWVNLEPANYPVVMGDHNLIADTAVGSLPGNKPFPTSTAMLYPGERWSCRSGGDGLECRGASGAPVVLTPGRYAYTCGMHPNQMRGLLIVS